MKKISVILVCVLMSALLLTACGSPVSGGGSADPGAAKGKRDQAILAVSFGTSYNDSRDKTIGAVEKAIQEAFPEYEVIYGIFSKSGFTKRMKDIAREHENIILINCDEIQK